VELQPGSCQLQLSQQSTSQNLDGCQVQPPSVYQHNQGLRNVCPSDSQYMHWVQGMSFI
jgi:hypothetical protein